jgi:hypothetical protein
MKMFISILLIFMVSLVTRAYSIDPCKKNTKGTDFWLAFMESRNYNPNHELRIIVTSNQTTFFTIATGPGNTPFNGLYRVDANIAKEVTLPWQTLETIGSENIQNRGIHLVSQDPVSVFAVNWDSY